MTTTHHLSLVKVGWTGGSWLIRFYVDPEGTEEHSAATSLAHAKRHALRLYNSYTGEKRKRLPWIQKEPNLFYCVMEQK